MDNSVVEAPTVTEATTEAAVETPKEVAAASEAIQGKASEFEGVADALLDIDLDDEAAVTEALSKVKPAVEQGAVATEQKLMDTEVVTVAPKPQAKSIKQLEKENKTTSPKVPVFKVFLNEPETLSPEQRQQTDKIFKEGTESSLPVETVSVNDIVPTQKSVTIPNLEKVSNLKGEAKEPVVLIKRGGKYFIADGHHRIANQILNGDTEIEARVSVEESPQETKAQEQESQREVAATVKAIKPKKGAKTVGESGSFEERTSSGRITEWKKEGDKWMFRNKAPKGSTAKFTAPDWQEASPADAKRIEEVAAMTKEQLDVRNAMADVGSKWKAMGET